MPWVEVTSRIKIKSAYHIRFQVKYSIGRDPWEVTSLEIRTIIKSVDVWQVLNVDFIINIDKASSKVCIIIGRRIVQKGCIIDYVILVLNDFVTCGDLKNEIMAASIGVGLIEPPNFKGNVVKIGEVTAYCEVIILDFLSYISGLSLIDDFSLENGDQLWNGKGQEDKDEGKGEETSDDRRLAWAIFMIEFWGILPKRKELEGFYSFSSTSIFLFHYL